MAIEFIGSAVPATGRLDPDYPVQVAAAAEEAGFDKLLVGYSASAPDGLIVADEMLSTTSRIGVMIAHVPGLEAPTVAARRYATLAAFHHGRVAMHAVTDPGAAGGPRDGDARQPAARIRRAAEFLEVVRLAWNSQQPFDYSGEFYRIANACAPVSAAGRGLPVYVSGEADEAMGAVAAHADVWLLDAAPAPAIAGQMARARALAGGRGGTLRFGVSLRLIAAPTEQAALDRRRGIRDRCQAAAADPAPWIPAANLGPANLGPASLGPASIGPPSGAQEVVGSYEQAAQALLGYLAIGVSTLVIGHDPLAEAADCTAVIARVREQAADDQHFVA